MVNLIFLFKLFYLKFLIIISFKYLKFSIFLQVRRTWRENSKKSCEAYPGIEHAGPVLQLGEQSGSGSPSMVVLFRGNSRI